jgi:hypothetical protein
MNEGTNFTTGALLDYRTLDERQKDWKHEELFAGGTTIKWIEKNPDQIKRYSPRNQGSSLSCVANGGAIYLEAAEMSESGNQTVFSHKDIYIRRYNKPGGGMAMHDLFKILKEGGAYESQVPSMNLGETPINQEYTITNEMRQTRATHAAGASITFDKLSIDSIASVIESGTPVICFWYFSSSLAYQEWWRQQPQVVNRSLGLYDADALHHQAIAIDYTMIDGKKYLYIQDSAGVGTGMHKHADIRLVSEDFIKSRLYAAGYAIDKKNLDFAEPTKPKYKFTRSLKYGMVGDDVMALQKILVYEKCLVLKTPTRNFLGATLGGVKKFQEKYAKDILAPVGLKIGTGFVGEMTLKKLNQLYS